MTCDEFERQLTAYLDGALNEADASALEQHAAECATCYARLDALTRLDAVPAQAERERLHASSLTAGMREQTLAAVSGRRHVVARNRWLRPMVAAAALLVVSISTWEYQKRTNASAVSQGEPVRAPTAVGAGGIDDVAMSPDRLAAERSSTEFLALDAAAREIEAALARTPDDRELRAFLSTVEARRDELTRRVKAARS